MRKVGLIALLMVCLGAVFFAGVAAATEKVPKVTPDQLKGMLGDANVIIIDTRLGTDWNDSDAKIKGAVRENPMQVDSWMNKYPKDKTLVFYCAWMNEATSAGLARKFLDNGYTKAYALKGGWKEWQAAGYPTEPK